MKDYEEWQLPFLTGSISLLVRVPIFQLPGGGVMTEGKLAGRVPIFQLPGGGVMTEGKLAGRVPWWKSSLTAFNFIKLHLICTKSCSRYYILTQLISHVQGNGYYVVTGAMPSIIIILAFATVIWEINALLK